MEKGWRDYHLGTDKHTNMFVCSYYAQLECATDGKIGAAPCSVLPLHHAESCTHMNVTGDVYNDSQDVDTLLALFTFTDTTCSETQLV